MNARLTRFQSQCQQFAWKLFLTLILMILGLGAVGTVLVNQGWTVEIVFSIEGNRFDVHSPEQYSEVAMKPAAVLPELRPVLKTAETLYEAAQVPAVEDEEPAPRHLASSPSLKQRY